MQRVAGTGARALGETVPLDNRYAVTVFEPVQQFDAGRRRTAYGESQRRRVRGQVGGQVGEHRVDGRHSGEVGCPAAFDAAEEAPGVEPAGDCGAPTDEQRRQRAHHDSVDVEQRQDQQAVVRLGQTERVDHHLAHRVQVGVVEHDALGTPGGATGIDQQRQRTVTAAMYVVTRRRVGGEAARGDLHRAHAEIAGRGDDQHLRGGVGDLVAGLVRRQRRIERRDGCPQAPGREQRHHQVDGVGKHDGHDVAGPDAVSTQRRCRPAHRVEELGVVQGEVVIGDARRGGSLDGSAVGQSGQVHGRVLRGRGFDRMSQP